MCAFGPGPQAFSALIALVTAFVANYATKPSYSVRVRATDSGGLSFAA